MKLPYQTSKDYKLLWDLIQEGYTVLAKIKHLEIDKVCRVCYTQTYSYSIFYIGHSLTPHKGLDGYSEYETFVMDCKEFSLEFVLPSETPTIQKEPKYTFGLSVKKQNPKPDAKTYKVETITDLYRLVTPENLERLTKDVVSILRLYAYQRQSIGDSDVEASFEWIDD